MTGFHGVIRTIDDLEVLVMGEDIGTEGEKYHVIKVGVV